LLEAASGKGVWEQTTDHDFDREFEDDDVGPDEEDLGGDVPVRHDRQGTTGLGLAGRLRREYDRKVKLERVGDSL
jgi:hypothetical protein